MSTSLRRPDRTRPRVHGPRWVASAAAPAVVAWLLVVGLLALYQVPVWHSLAYTGYLAVVIVLPGRLVWQWLTERAARPASQLELWTCGAATGYALEIAAYPVARFLAHPRWYVVVPVLVLVVLGVRAWRHRPGASEDLPGRHGRDVAGVAWGLGAVAVYFAVHLSVMIFDSYRLAPYRLLEPDETFHLALVGELRHHFPPRYPQMEAGELTYQWFPHAHMAASTWITGLEPLEVYRRFDVLVLGLLCVLGTAAVASYLTRRAWPGLVAASVLVLVGSFDITGTVRGQSVTEDRFLEPGLLLNSPTQTLAFAFAPAVMLLCLRLLEPGEPAKRWWPALLVGLSAMAGAKVTFVPMFACGFVAAGAVALWRRSGPPGRAVLGLAGCALTAAASGLLLYRGDTQSLSWRPGGTGDWFLREFGAAGTGLFGNLLVTAALLLGWSAPALGAVGLLRVGTTRWAPCTWFLLGSAAAGFGATFLLFHVGMSQFYFGRSTAPLLAVAAAWGFSVLLPQGTPRSRWLAVGGAALLGGATLLGIRLVTQPLQAAALARDEAPALPFWLNAPVFLTFVVMLLSARALVRDLSRRRLRLPLVVALAFLTGLGLARTMAFTTGTFPSYDDDNAISMGSGALEATRWLREASRPDDRVLTNAHCLPGPLDENSCDSRHFWMSALTERRFVLEGWAYTRFQEKWTAPFWGDPDFLEANDALFSSPDDGALEAFLADHAAEWLLVDRSLPADVEALRASPLLAQVFQRGRYTVFRVL